MAYRRRFNMTDDIPTRSEAEAILKICECGKKTPTCGTIEICVTCMQKLNPKQFKETLEELLDTWTANRPDVEIEELHSLCPAIGSMIRLESKGKPESGDMPCENI
jgi:hypothetical protein